MQLAIPRRVFSERDESKNENLFRIFTWSRNRAFDLVHKLVFANHDAPKQVPTLDAALKNSKLPEIIRPFLFLGP